MNARRNRFVVSGAIVAGTLVLGGAGYALKDRLVEEWYIWKLRSEDFTEDFTERFDAARNLGGMRSTRAIPGLVALLQESREHTTEARDVWGSRANPCQSMAAVLAEIGPPVLPSLAKALADSDGTIAFWRRSACQTLRKIGTDSALPALIARVKDRDGCVGLVAVRALGSMGSRAIEAVPALTTALGSEKPYMRNAASEALEAIRGPETVAEVRTN